MKALCRKFINTARTSYLQNTASGRAHENPRGAGLDTSRGTHAFPLECHVKHIWTEKNAPRTPRAAERVPLTLPARLTWKDQRGTTRFASVVTRDVSDMGVYVESHTAVSIPLYRLVQFQLEPQGRDIAGVPDTLKSGRVLSAVYRVKPSKPSGERQGFALRLMVDPRRRRVAPAEDVRATA